MFSHQNNQIFNQHNGYVDESSHQYNMTGYTGMSQQQPVYHFSSVRPNRGNYMMQQMVESSVQAPPWNHLPQLDPRVDQQQGLVQELDNCIMQRRDLEMAGRGPSPVAGCSSQAINPHAASYYPPSACRAATVWQTTQNGGNSAIATMRPDNNGLNQVIDLPYPINHSPIGGQNSNMFIVENNEHIITTNALVHNTPLSSSTTPRTSSSTTTQHHHHHPYQHPPSTSSNPTANKQNICNNGDNPNKVPGEAAADDDDDEQGKDSSIPEEMAAFAKELKKKRISMGLTQAEVGKALIPLYGKGYSQTTICRFESLELSSKNMRKLKPLLQKWLEIETNKDLQEVVSQGPPVQQMQNRKQRTSIEAVARERLESYFMRCQKPGQQEIAQIAQEVNLDKDVTRVWFCNRRQKGKRQVQPDLQENCGETYEMVQAISQPNAVPFAMSQVVPPQGFAPGILGPNPALYMCAYPQAMPQEGPHPAV